MNLRIFIVLIFLLLFSLFAFAELSCTSRLASCNAGEIVVMRISDNANAHAEFPTQSNYNNLICCFDNDPTVNLDPNNFTTNSGSNFFASLSNLTNAHAEFPSSAYTNSLYLNSTNPNKTYTCNYFTSLQSEGGCIYALSDSTNAHVSNCTDPLGYSNYVYCSTTNLGSKDIFKVKITKITNQATGIETTIFSRDDTMKIEVTVINHALISIEETLKVRILNSHGEDVKIPPFTTTVVFGSGSESINRYDFSFTGLPKDSYQIVASIPVKPGEENFYKNNISNEFVTLVQRSDPIAVPDTNIFQIPIIAILVITLLYVTNARKKSK